MARIVVGGGRDFRDRDLLFEALDIFHKSTPVSLLIEGGQRTIRNSIIVGGADWYANRWAKSRGVHVVTYEAQWNAFGRAAGPIRNRQMLDCDPSHVFAFDTGGSGTADLINQASIREIRIIRIVGGLTGV